jgi:hypothetical protein
MGFSKSEVLEAMATIWLRLCEGEKEKDIMDEMGLTAEEFKAFQSALYDAKADEIRSMPEEHLYVKYIQDQAVNIHDLTEMIGNFKNTKQYNAQVGAIRVRSEIADKIIAKGQEFGLIKKTPDRKEIVAGVLVANLSNNQLKEGITAAIGQLDGLVNTYGETDFAELPKPGQLHYGPQLPEHKGLSDMGTDMPPIAAEAFTAQRKKVKAPRKKKKRVTKGDSA